MGSLGNESTVEKYLDFELEIGAGSGRRYPVTVIQSAAGEAREVMRFPFDDLALENQLLILQNVLLRSGGRLRRVPLTEEQAVQRFGQALFEALFIGEVRSRYAVSQQEAFSQGKGLRLKLRIQSSALSALPWEFLYDPGQGEYICLSSNTPIVRYLELPRPPQPLTVTPPLRILGMIASPENLVDLDVEREQLRVERATERLRASGNVTLTWLEGQTWQDLQRAMRRGPWHIFHFIGHGGYDSNADEGLIVLTNDDGQARYLSATQLGRLLTDHRPLRLVILNSCEGARGGKRDIFSSTAATLVRRGVPAVLAMQYEITDQAAIELSRAFYEAIADGMPVDTAVGEARKAISLGVVNTLEWGTPVLYMRSPDGALFSVASLSLTSREPPSAPAKERATSSSRERAVEEGISAGTSSEETEHISSVTSSPTNVQVPPPVQSPHPPSRVPLGEPSSVAPSEDQVAHKAAADMASTNSKQTSRPEAFPSTGISSVHEKPLEEQARKAEEERVRQVREEERRRQAEEERAGQTKEQADRIEEKQVRETKEPALAATEFATTAHQTQLPKEVVRSSKPPALRSDATVTAKPPKLGASRSFILLGLAVLMIVALASGIVWFTVHHAGSITEFPVPPAITNKAPTSQQVLNMPFQAGISDIKTLDPALSTDSPSIAAIDLVFTGLVQFNNKLQVQPQLAASYQEAPDGLTWTFNLKPNLNFSDGTPLTSTDVAYSINRALLPATKSSVAPFYLALLKDSDKLEAGTIPTIIGDSILTPDARTIVLITNKKASYFLDALAYSCSYVVEKSLITKYGAKFTDHLNEGGGAGPFKVQSYTHGTDIVFVPNPNYYGPKPQLTKLIYPFIKNTAISFEAYQAGQAYYSSVPTADLATAKAFPNNQYQLIPQLWINYFTMNYLVKPFDNIHIRQAFDLAINKDLIAHAVWKDTALATNHIVPKGMPGYNPNLAAPEGVTGTSGDPTKAKALFQQGLQEEGWSSVSQMPAIKLTYPSGDPNLSNEIATVQQMWQTTLGIYVKANPEDFNKLLTDSVAATNNANGLQFWRIAWIADYPDPQDWTTLQFGKGSQYNQINYGQNNSSDAAAQQQVQAQLAAADINPDQTSRMQAYNQAEQQLVNDVAWLPMEQVAVSQVLKPYVKGMVFNSQSLIPPDDWSNIYIASH